MSSRNQRLTEQEKEQATVLYRVMNDLRLSSDKGSIVEEKQKAVAAIKQAGLDVDYFEIADGLTLQPLTDWDSSHPTNAFVAAFAGQVRLIDNMILFA